MTLEEARALYARIPTMTVREMREAGRLLRVEWLSNASKITKLTDEGEQ